MREWLAGHAELLEDLVQWQAEDARDAVEETEFGLPEAGGNGGPAEHWLQVATAAQRLRVIHQRLTDSDTARPVHQALKELTSLLRSVDNYLSRAAVRGIPAPSRQELAAAAAAAPAPFAQAQDATAALAGLQQAWREWARTWSPSSSWAKWNGTRSSA